jgi:hypothetical protein
VGGLFLPSASSPSQVLVKVDLIHEKEMLHVYVLSGIGGLVLLFLIFLALYKVRAFRWLSWGQRRDIGMDQEERAGPGRLRAQTSLSSLHRPQVQVRETSPSLRLTLAQPGLREERKRRRPYTEDLLIAETALGPVKQRCVIYT